MKFQTITLLAALGTITFFSACGGEATTDETSTQSELTSPTDGQSNGQIDMSNLPGGGPDAAPPPSAEPPQNAAGVWHYTCTKGCAGGAGSASACATCGATLVHNQAYHPAPTGTPSVTPATPGSTPGQTIQVPAPATPEPPQNAKGVWHYTCPGGCADGGGGATPCGKCGKTLAHNPAYHQ